MTARIYLDFNATTPPLDDVVEAQREAAKVTWANPSSIHADGRRARAVVEDARAKVAALAECDARDVVFTSGGTEANNIALRSAMAKRKGALVTSRLEHPSIVRVAEDLEREGRTVHWAAADPSGAIDLAALAKYVHDTNEIAAFAVQAVNHETGVIQPLAAVAELARSRDAWLHVDAVQAFGRIADVASLATSRAVSAHKLRGPKSVGALVTQPDVDLVQVVRGGSQERGIRPGTVDATAIAGFGVAADHARTSAACYAAVAELRDWLERELVTLGGQVNGSGARASHVTNVSFPKWIGAELVAALDLEGVSVSSGSACSAGTVEPSAVIAAFAGDARAKSSVRISLGTTTTREEIERARDVFARVVTRI